MKSLLLIVFISVIGICFTQSDEEVENPLITAVKANNLKEVKRLVEAGENIDVENHFDDDPIDIAILNDYREIALFLLSKGATSRQYFYTAVTFNDLNWVKTLVGFKYYDAQAILPAIENKNTELVKYLIAQGFPVNFEQKRKSGLFRKYYVSPLEAAFDLDADDIVYDLVKAGAPVTDAFYSAALYEKNDLGKKLIDLNLQKNDLFLESVNAGNLVLLNYSITKGADKTAQDEKGRNALLLAAKNGNEEIYSFCLKTLSLSPNSLTLENENALMLACQSKNEQLVKNLLGINQNLEFENASGETALFYAERSQISPLLELFLTRKPNVNHKDQDGNTVLLNAAFANRVNHLKLLVPVGADIHVLNNNKQNIISGLLENYSSNKSLIFELIEIGVDAKVKTSDGRDFAFIAIERSDLELLKLLKSKGLSVDGRNGSGQRPSTKNLELMRFVLDNGGDPNARDSWNQTYLCTALDMNDVDFASFVLSHNAALNIPSCFMDELLIFEAIDKKKLTFLQFLVENKADLYVKSRHSKNVMEYALDQRNEEIIAYLRSKGALTKDELNKREVERIKEMQQLHDLIKKKDLTSILMLLKKYPESVLMPSETQVLADFSAQTGSLDLLQICLEQYKWDVNAHVNFEQQTLLHVATKNGLIDFVKLVVNKGGNYNQLDAFNKTPINYSKTKELKQFYKSLKSKK